MSDLWDDVGECEVGEADDSVNKYLSNKDEAMNLVSRILAFNKDDKNLIRCIFKLDKLIEEDLLKIICKVDMERETDVYLELKNIKNKLYELNMINLLNNKSIVGIGGMFSAGKSKFINSIINNDILPENQLPTTSIPTYITKGKDRLSANTFNNLNVELDCDAVNAISHIFYDEYKISFSRFIKSIVIENEKYPFDNIILLDTPGYTKSESHKKDGNTDESIARENLKVCDYLIWLMDIENGIITNDDITFINNLKIDMPILFIFNKADKKCEKDIKEILSSTKEILKKNNINVFGVSAYSSLDKKEYFNNYIEMFFDKVKNKFINSEDIFLKVEKLLEEYSKYFEIKKEKLAAEKDSISKSIVKSDDLAQMINLGSLYSQINSEVILNNVRKKEFEKVKKYIIEEVNRILNK